MLLAQHRNTVRRRPAEDASGLGGRDPGPRRPTPARGRASGPFGGVRRSTAPITGLGKQVLHPREKLNSGCRGQSGTCSPRRQPRLRRMDSIVSTKRTPPLATHAARFRRPAGRTGTRDQAGAGRQPVQLHIGSVHFRFLIWAQTDSETEAPWRRRSRRDSEICRLVPRWEDAGAAAHSSECTAAPGATG
jgi:hypothetical protein